MARHYRYLTMTAGSRVGAHFLLDASQVVRIGRGTDCDIILLDPLCSRVHAELFWKEDAWWLRDAGSRNGTYVGEQKVDVILLEIDCRFQVGSTEFHYHESAHPPGQGFLHDTKITETIIREAAMDGQPLVGSARPDGAPPDFTALYELSVRMLESADPDEVVQSALALLHRRTSASVVGFLWASEEGQLKPKIVYPAQASPTLRLSESLTQVVCRQAHAVWIANQTAAHSTSSLAHYADAICVPLVQAKRTLGAVHVYRHEGRFRQHDFEFAISLANLLAVGLVRARQQATLQADHQRLKESSAIFDELLGESPAMRELKSKTERVARATGCVLVRGESGSGKELVARALHRASPRADRPLLSVNCAAIPAELMESQLFGHRRGAFTGADRDHAGWFQQADSGTLFLDEVGELSLVGQAKLLRILEGHPFLPVGSSEEITVDVRVLAATNRDLRELVQGGTFRDDLYYRLSVFELIIPPLRERGTDMELLIHHFLDHFGRKHGRPGIALSPTALRKLLGYHWPGNVRQLRNVIDSSVVMAETESIQPEELGLRDVATDRLESLKISDWEQQLIREALQRTGGNIPEAALLLGIGRATLYRKLDEYGMRR